MRRPSQKAVIVFLLALGAGFVVSYLFMVGLLATELRLYGWVNLTVVALLIAVLLMVWLDRPLDLELFKWQEAPPKEEKTELEPAPTAPEAGARVSETSAVQLPNIPEGAMFPHEIPTEHWDVDFGDTKQVYEGTALPIWLLAGWAAFIIWAVIYLISGLPTFHY